MYAVIFRATVGMLDQEYETRAEKLREKAFAEHGCLEFVSLREGSEEIAISYWANEEQIKRWKQDFEHAIAQELGKSRWYQSYQVQIVKIEREYRNSSRNP